MEISTIAILIIIGIILFLQYTIAKSSNQKIHILEGIFSDGKKDKEQLFATRKVYVPKKALKNITVEDIVGELGKYSNEGDDIEKTVVIDQEKLELLTQLAFDEGGPFSYEDAKKDCEVVVEKVTCKASDKEEITFISIDNNNEVASEIERSINTYLLKNKGAVSDFNLIKDVVERNCDALDAEIESQTPMPLYLGLMGTMSGIILGLGMIGLTSGFGDIQKVVNSLMSEVAIAMFASALGVLATTVISWNSKQSKAKVESDKNRFYTWIQTELLPVLSSNTVSTLTLLERNLSKFNDSFKITVNKLDTKLAEVGDTYNQQIELLRIVQQLDVNKMAKANVTILEALNRSTSNLQAFAEYMDNTTDYLNGVRQLTGKIDAHLERTESLETIADFYKKQMDEIKTRQSALSSTVVSVDDALQGALADLQSKTSTSLSSLNRVFRSQEEEMEKMVQNQSSAFDEKLKKFDTAISLLEKLPALSSAITKLEKASSDQARALNTLADSFRKFKVTSNNMGGTNIHVGDDGTIWNRIQYVLKGSSAHESSNRQDSGSKIPDKPQKSEGGKWYDKDKSSKPPVPKKM